MASDGFEGMIAERRLTLIADNGEMRYIVVRIGKPEPRPDQTGFSCEWQVVGLGLGEGKIRRIYGSDGFHALHLTLRFLSTLLNHYRNEANGRIYWLEPGDDMGFAEVEPPAQS
jgi:hypothetical protein